MPRDDIDLFHIAAAIAACLVAVGLYRWMGFFGVGLLGLLVVFVVAKMSSSRMGAAAAAPCICMRGKSPPKIAPARSEKAGLRSDRRRQRSSHYALTVGLAFLCVGGIGFALFQLHLGR